MTPEDVALELDVLASRVRRLLPPVRAGNPDRFYEERSEHFARLTVLQWPQGRRVDASSTCHAQRTPLHTGKCQ